jgi:hypothetical protein
MEVNKEQDLNLSFYKKVVFFVFALFAETLISEVIYKFIKRLSNESVISVFENHYIDYYYFNPQFDIIWGAGVFNNLIAILIIGIRAALFGYLFGYLSRILTKKELLLYSFSYLLIRYILLSISYLIIFNFYNSYYNNFLNIIISPYFKVLTSIQNIFFFAIQNLTLFIASFYSFKTGSNSFRETHYFNDKITNNTLYDIKIYHYVWLSYSISIYSRVLLNFFYDIVVLISKMNAFGGEGVNIEDNYAHIIPIIIIVVIIYFFQFIRNYLSGETTENKLLKFFYLLCICFIIPTLIIIYTKLAN